MEQLSYADRAAILEIVDRFKGIELCADDVLLREVSNFLLSHYSRAGFEHALSRDAVALCNHLRTSSDPVVTQTARCALHYLLEADDFIADHEPVRGFMDDAYVLNLALHEISALTATPILYGAPEISEDERRECESQLEHFVEKPFCSDEELVERARDFCRRLRTLADSGYLGRMCQNVEWMAGCLESQNDTESLPWVRGALSYLACPADVIPDDLGIVGYLDDRYVIETAMAMIRPQPDPWLASLNEAVGNWPFLNGLILSENGSRCTLSEFILANAAIGLRQLCDAGDHLQAGLVLPVEGPMPVLLSFITGLGMIHGKHREADPTLNFETGQKVLVDGSAVWKFGGFGEINGRPMFNLAKPARHRGRDTETSRWWPVKDLCRIRPADESRTFRGRIFHDLSQSSASIGAIDRLLHTRRPIQFVRSDQRVLCVSPVTKARGWLTRLRLYGERLVDVFPIGGVSVDGEIGMWSDRWKGVEPLLLFASNLDVASEVIDEDNAQQTAMVTVDGHGSIAQQGASLRRICRKNVPMLAVARERDHSDLQLLSEEAFRLFEWEPRDVSELLWSLPESDSKEHAFRKYERRIIDYGDAIVEVRCVECSETKAAHDALILLRRIQSERDNEIDELRLFAAQTGRTLYRMSQAAVSEVADGLLWARIDREIAEAARLISGCIYVSEQERAASHGVIQALKQLRRRLADGNPKTELVSQLLHENAEITLVCRDTAVAESMDKYWGACASSARAHDNSQSVEVLVCPIVGEVDRERVTVICGWFGKKRMPELLHPPVSRRVILLLYDQEKVWYDAYQRSCDSAKRCRSTASERHIFLGTASAWRNRDCGMVSSRPAEDPLPQETADDHLDDLWLAQRRTIAIQRAVAGAENEPEVETRILWLPEGAHAFLTMAYKAMVVTHLLESTLPAGRIEKADVKTVHTSELRVGDYLLFHRGSGADAIRAVADQIPGVPEQRRLAKAWQRALRRFRDRDGLDTREVWKRLRDGGCEHQLLTIRNWLEDDDMIAPRDAHDHELRIIAAVTRDAELQGHMRECDEAIHTVWGAHLTASHHLAKRVIERSARALAAGDNELHSGLVEIEPSVLIAKVVEIDTDTVHVKRSMSNRLLEGDDD